MRVFLHGDSQFHQECRGCKIVSYLAAIDQLHVLATRRVCVGFSAVSLCKMKVFA